MDDGIENQVNARHFEISIRPTSSVESDAEDKIQSSLANQSARQFNNI
jgi:hypothetical protein